MCLSFPSPDWGELIERLGESVAFGIVFLLLFPSPDWGELIESFYYDSDRPNTIKCFHPQIGGS